MHRGTLLLAAHLGLVAAALAAPTRIPVAGINPQRGSYEGTLDVELRTDGQLSTDLQLELRSGGTIRIRGLLEREAGSTWRRELRVPAGVAGALGGGGAEDGFIRFELEADAGLVEGIFRIGGATPCYFADHHARQPVTDQRATAALAPGAPGYETTVQVRYFGAAGYHVRRGPDELLFAPFFSATPFGDVAASEVAAAMRPNLARIAQALDGLPPISGSRALLVGHGHYDHLMDVPPLARAQVREARILCNLTSRNVLAGEPDGAALVARTTVLEDHLGQWIPIPGARIRVMPLLGEHPPHLVGLIEFYRGQVLAPRTTPPRKASDWKGGQTFVFLVDFLDDQGAVAYRIYYQDAAPALPRGAVPAAVLAERRVDLAIYCMSLHETVHGFPEELTRLLDPRVIVLGHWEDIFRPLPGIGATRARPLDQLDLRLVMSTKPRQCVRDLNTARSADSRWIMPLPGSLWLFPPG